MKLVNFDINALGNAKVLYVLVKNYLREFFP